MPLQVVFVHRKHFRHFFTVLRLMSVRLGPETLVSDREEEHVKWERRLEEFCEAREEAIQILKSSGEVDLKVHTDSLSKQAPTGHGSSHELSLSSPLSSLLSSL